MICVHHMSAVALDAQALALQLASRGGWEVAHASHGQLVDRSAHALDMELAFPRCTALFSQLRLELALGLSQVHLPSSQPSNKWIEVMVKF